MGVLANHVPIVEALKPGVIEVIEEGGSSKKWFGTSAFCKPSFRVSQPTHRAT